MSSKGGGFNNRDDDVMMLLFGVSLLLVLLAAVIWFLYHTYLSWVAIQAASLSLPIINAFYEGAKSFNTPSVIIDLFIPKLMITDISSMEYWVPKTNPVQVKFNEFLSLLEITGYCARLLSPFISFIAIAYVWNRSKAARLSRTMDIFTLAQHMTHEFPQIRPAIIANLLKKDPDKGFYRREASPMRLAIQYELLKSYGVDFKGDLLNELSIPTFDKKKTDSNESEKSETYEYVVDDYDTGIAKLHNRCILDKQKTKEVFIRQLGEPWTGSENLTPFVKALYAALIVFACSDKDKCFEMLDQYNRSWVPPDENTNTGSLDVTGSDELIAQYEKTERIQSIISKHGYVTTVMAGLLEAAREKGRLNTPLFFWLKVIDRELWYSLNQEGGQCGWSEAAGPRAHKLAEEKAKGGLFHPCVDMAVLAFELYLGEDEGWTSAPQDIPDNN